MAERVLRNIAVETRATKIGGGRQRKFSRKSIDQIKKVAAIHDLVREWDDWTEKGFDWLGYSYRVLRPPPPINIPQWADLYRQITSEFSAESGQWHTDKFEPMREIMEACSPGNRFRRVVLVKPTQSGGTESCVLNPIGYTIDVNPRSMLVVFPTIDSSESFSRERLEPMIKAMPHLDAKVVEIGATRGKGGGASSTVKKKKYPGGFLNMVGANSTTGLSSRPVPIVIIDEVDLCIKNASKQGNPVKLALARTTTYPDKKEILLSSPSNEEGESGIISFWGEGTQAKLERECPNINCRHYQVLEFERMDLDTAMLACEKCGAYFEQWQWQQGVGSFRWNHEFPDDSTTASFWMTGLDSPWLDWKIDIIEDYRNCKKIEEQGDDSQMRVFVNSKLTKEFRRRGKTVDIDLYHDRREVYECHTNNAEVPDGVILITAGVDVQDSFIVYDIVGWGRGRESWMLETGNFQGDPRIPESIVWKQLDEFVYRRIWRYSNGDYIRTRLMFVDSGGHATDDVYKYCKSRHPRCFAIKGVEGSGNAIIVGGGLKRRQKIVEGVWLIKIGSDTVKDELHTRLAITNIGPGYCHWPMLPNSMPTCGYTLEYFEEIISEQREIKFNKAGFAEYKWTKNRTDPNEALDCQVYARAALEYLKVRLEQMPRDIIKIGERDIDKVEIGLGREIIVEKERMRTKPKVNQYGGQTVIGGSDISSTSIFGQEIQERSSSQGGSSQGSGYGAVGTSF